MDEGRRAGRGSSGAEDLILRTVAAHADSLLRTARRHSICVDDAHDAYQRGLEIFMAHADRLDPARAAGWLHVVVKREAQSIRRSRKKLVGSTDVDFDAHVASRVPTPEEQLLSFEMVNRSAEALQRLKPQELRALWLKAQGHSYNEIAAITGWTYTKVNRCLTEGRRSFLERYSGIESGAECQRWMPVLCLLVDGEATSEQILELRPHLRNCAGCRATLKALRDSAAPLSVVLPIPLAAAATGGGEQVSTLVMRAYEAIAGGLHERAVHSVTKAQAAMEAAAAGKVAAVAASAAAVAGGGYATVERTVRHEPAREARMAAQHKPVHQKPKLPARPVAAVAPPPAPVRRVPRAVHAGNWSGGSGSTKTAPEQTEFDFAAGSTSAQPISARAATSTSNSSGTTYRRSSINPASAAPREFASPDTGSEFGP